MDFIGFHVSQEQIPPSRALEAVVDAEAAGFDGAFSANHLAPWTPEQGESGNTFVWWGAALARTGFSIGAIATPGDLYHPVLTAHALATVGEMYPGRGFAALGSGELLNEHVTGNRWPDHAERTARLGECVEVIRALLRGEEVTHSGLVHVHEARLWSVPAVAPELYATATSSATAAWAAGWADGLLTVAAAPEAIRPVLDAYRDAGGRGGAAVQIHLSYHGRIERAVQVAREQWAHAVVAPPERWELARPEEFAARATQATDADLHEHVVISDDLDDLAARIAAIAELGFERVYLHDVDKDQTRFLRDVAPALLARLRDFAGVRA
jgi:probable non-F420 flavinoid oxidoreductase